MEQSCSIAWKWKTLNILRWPCRLIFCVTKVFLQDFYNFKYFRWKEIMVRTQTNPYLCFQKFSGVLKIKETSLSRTVEIKVNFYPWFTKAQKTRSCNKITSGSVSMYETSEESKKKTHCIGITNNLILLRLCDT